MKNGLIPRDVLFGNAERSQARISPDGTMLAYLAPSDGKMSVWVRTIGRDDDRLVAHDPARPIPWIAWQADGQHVLFLQDSGGNENYHLFQVGLDGGQARELTPGENVRCTPLAIDHRFPFEALVSLNERNPALFDICRIDFRTGSLTTEAENPGDVIAWLADHTFAVRAAVAQTPDGSTEIRVRDDAGGQWRVLDTIASSDSIPDLVAFSPDNRSLYAISAKDANASRLVKYDLTAGTYDAVLEDPRYDVAGVYTDPSTYAVVAAAVLRERLGWTVLDAQYQPTFEALGALHDGDFTIDDSSADGNTLIVHYRSDVGPTHYYAFDRRAAQATLLFVDRPRLFDYTLAPMRPIAFEARDGLRIEGYLTLPLGVEPHNLPTILFVHGGPWHRDRWGYDEMAQWLANRGYAVLQVNFRGSTGYGKAFLNAGNREWAGAMRTDLIDAREWAVAQGFADPDRFAIFGGSYGGYAVLAALTFTPDAFTCGVDVVGPSNLNTLLETIPPYWEPMRRVFYERMGEDPEFLNSQSPLFRAKDIRVPLLVAQGANDPRVKQTESDQLVGAMRENQIPVTYIVFDNEGHGFANPENNKRFTALAERFFAQTLGGKLQPPQPDEDFEPFLR
ncbi:MAG TPA: S9 family peptidase [Candidatus Baltobacteraceae bacterium]